MRVTFPHMGTAHLTLATLLTDVGLEPVVPPPTSCKTLALGVRHAPEFACFPLKVNLGNYLESIPSGVDGILMVGGVGPCRLGYYAEVQREILRDLGHDVQMIALEPPQKSWRDLWGALKRIMPGISVGRLASSLKFAYDKISVVDEIERLANRIRPREVNRGETSGVWRKCQEILAPVTDGAGLQKARQLCRDHLSAVVIEAERPVLRVALAGEIFMVLESAVNFQLEKVLGENGVEVERHIYLSDWIRHHLLPSVFSPQVYKRTRALARPYLGHTVGGHGLESVAEAVDCAVNRLDGMIQVAPFTCMPEIMAQSVLPQVSRDLDMPAMTLVIDEHAGEAGVMTRIEAFLDLLARRRRKEGIELASVFSGY